MTFLCLLRAAVGGGAISLPDDLAGLFGVESGSVVYGRPGDGRGIGEENRALTAPSMYRRPLDAGPYTFVPADGLVPMVREGGRRTGSGLRLPVMAD